MRGQAAPGCLQRLPAACRCHYPFAMHIRPTRPDPTTPLPYSPSSVPWFPLRDLRTGSAMDDDSLVPTARARQANLRRGEGGCRPRHLLHTDEPSRRREPWSQLRLRDRRGGSRTRYRSADVRGLVRPGPLAGLPGDAVQFRRELERQGCGAVEFDGFFATVDGCRAAFKHPALGFVDALVRHRDL